MQQGKLPPQGPVTVAGLYALHDEDADGAPVHFPSMLPQQSQLSRVYLFNLSSWPALMNRFGRPKSENSPWLDKLQQPCPRAPLGIIIEIPGRSGCVQIHVKYICTASSSVHDISCTDLKLFSPLSFGSISILDHSLQ